MRPIETARLVLRPLAASDRDWLVGLYTEAGGLVDDAVRELDQALEHARVHGFGHMVAERRTGGDRAAIVELHLAGEGITGIAPDEVEIGWVVARARRGHGLATEAAGAVATWALGELGLDHLVAYVRTDNAVSLRVAEKIGMRRRGAGRSRSGAPVHVLELRRHGAG